jgi:hypothetical protein
MKVFLNFCHSPYCPAPPLASDEEIKKEIASMTADQQPNWKIPMSLMGPKDDLDKGRQHPVFRVSGGIELTVIK